MTRDRLYLQQYVWDIKEESECRYCGEDHPACLDFHHIDPGRKSGNIGDLIRKRYTKQRLQAEIDKCEVVCSNCHRKKHSRSPYERSTTHQT